MKFIQLKSKRGSYLPEAAIVFTFSILVTITVVLIVMFFYEQSISQCQMHMALRCEAGERAGTVRYESELGERLTSESFWHGEITCSGKGPRRKYQGSTRVFMRHQGILNRLGTSHLTGSCHSSSGKEFIRLCNLIKP